MARHGTTQTAAAGPEQAAGAPTGTPALGRAGSSGGQQVPSVISSTKYAMSEAAQTQNSDNLNRNHVIMTAKLMGIIGWEGQRPAQAGRGMPNSVSYSAKLPLSVWASWHFAAPLHS